MKLYKISNKTGSSKYFFVTLLVLQILYFLVFYFCIKRNSLQDVKNIFKKSKHVSKNRKYKYINTIINKHLLIKILIFL